MAATEQGQLDLFLPLSDPNLPWLGVLVGVPILGSTFGAPTSSSSSGCWAPAA